MKAQNNSILLVLLLIILLSTFLAGCATTSDYTTYVETQKTLNRDYTMAELARISALTEIVRESQDVNVKIEAIRALQELQKNRKPLTIDRPKSWLER